MNFLTISTALFLVFPISTSAHPFTPSPGPILQQPASNNTNNLPILPGTPLNENLIYCFPHKSSEEASPSACTNILRAIRRFPHYPDEQTWITGVSPRTQVGEPPYHLTSQDAHEGKCTMTIEAANPDPFVREVMSWELVVKVLHAIVGQCASPGRGGFARVGERRLYTVEVTLSGLPV